MLIKKISDISGLATTTVLNTEISEIENNTPDTSSLETTNVLNTEDSEIDNKISDNSKYIPTQEFNKLMAENSTARLKQAV